MRTHGRAVARTGFRLVLLSLMLSAATYAQPDTAWLFTYPASEFGESQPLAAFFDDTGNVYVAGWSEKEAERPDVLLLKIDSLGQLVWDRTYPDVFAVGAARDTAGNIYITGFSDDTSDGWLHTLKYTPSGDLEWAKSYTEPHRRFRSMVPIAIDDIQNVYACGRAESASCAIVRILKYRPDGVLANVMSYTLSKTMTLGGGRFHILSDGGAYLALTFAYRPENWPCRRLIVRLSSQGSVLWKRVYRDKDSTWDDIEWSQIDEHANIYITGTTTRPDGFRTVKMDSSGKVRWTGLYWFSRNTSGGRGFLSLHDGSVYVASGMDTIRLVKYDSLGNQIWLNKYGNGDFMLGYGQGYDEPHPNFCCMNVDDSGSVYLTGEGAEYISRAGHTDCSLFAFLVKYDPQGHLLWEKERPWTSERPDGLPEVSWEGAIVGFDKKGALYDIGVGGADVERAICVLKYRTR